MNALFVATLTHFSSYSRSLLMNAKRTCVEAVKRHTLTGLRAHIEYVNAASDWDSHQILYIQFMRLHFALHKNLFT